MESKSPAPELDFTGERVVPGKTPAFLLLEHLVRYRFAARLARGRKVLDVGCGTGYGAALLAETARAVVGIDNAPEAVHFARLSYRRPRLSFALGDCRQLPFRDHFFDLVVLFEVIEHLVEQTDCLAEIRRVLKADGQLILSTPNPSRASKAIEEENPFHHKELSEDELRGLLRPHFRHVGLLYQHELSASSLQNPTNRAGRSVEVVEDSSGGGPAKYFVAVCGPRLTRLPPNWLLGATGTEEQIAIVRDLRGLQTQVELLLRDREQRERDHAQNLAAHRREIEAHRCEIEALQRDREQRERHYAANLAAHQQEVAAQQREIEALRRDREAREQGYARNLAAPQEVIRSLEARVRDLERRLREEIEVRDRQTSELERQNAAQRMELDWLYRWLPFNRLARRLLYGRNLRRRLLRALRLAP